MLRACLPRLALVEPPDTLALLGHQGIKHRVGAPNIACEHGGVERKDEAVYAVRGEPSYRLRGPEAVGDLETPLAARKQAVEDTQRSMPRCRLDRQYRQEFLRPDGEPSGLHTRVAAGQLRPFDMSSTTPEAEWRRLQEQEFGDEVFPMRAVTGHRRSRRGSADPLDFEFKVVWITEAAM